MMALAFNGFSLGEDQQTFQAGDVWVIDVTSDKPVTPEQFFAFVAKVQPKASMPIKVLSFMPIDQTHFQAVVQMQSTGSFKGAGHTDMVDGVVFTVTSAHPQSETSKGLSTGAIAGIVAAGAAAFGGIVYLATRKPRRRHP
jgi:hypothetical protein